jgi:Zn-dependent M28 family amino/carboxypeptidase
MKKIFLLILIAGSAHAQSAFKNVSGILNTVQPDSIKAHIAYLADDKLKGRAPGTEGYQMAIDYVVSHFKQFGLEPAGENGTYLQEVKLRRAKVKAAKSTMSFSAINKTLVYGSDFVLNPHLEISSVFVNAPLVFAGYGISAPEFGYDDYKNLDVTGKVVVIVSGAPESFSSTVKAHFMSRATIAQTAVAKGAIGVIIKTADNIAIKGSVSTATVTGVNTLLNSQNELFVYSSRGVGGLGLNMFGLISHSLFKELTKISDEEMTKRLSAMKAGTPAIIDIQSNVSAQVVSTHENITSYNVVGVFPGSDPVLKNQYIVHSAHLDHLGITKAVKGDSINNGAHDNASGASCTLEVARLYSQLKQKPKRSVLFVMVTGEEMGLLGSTYFGEYPTVNKAAIVANVNMDMPTIVAPLLSVVPLGAEHSSLMNQVKAAASYLKLDVEKDPEPNENRFVRSDQYSFVRQGIPALHIKYGDKTNTPGEKLSDFVKKWRAEIYHQPQDQLEGGIFDFNAGKKYVQLNFLISYQVAQELNPPTWNKGDFFGERFNKPLKREM